MKVFIAWIAYVLGFHVCTSFTKWEKGKVPYMLIDTRNACVIPNSQGVDIYEQRQCIECGHFQQRLLEG